MAVATRSENHWHVHPLINVTEPSSLFTNLKIFAPQSGCVLAGFDFPIGLPYPYAIKSNITDFLTSLIGFGSKEWQHFYTPAENPSQISIHRPFYPARPGHSTRKSLERGLDLQFSQLYRRCEIAHDNRRAACPIFWTLGGQQVGKAAIFGWQSLLTSALADPDLNIFIWPFSGYLDSLTLPGNIVVVEAYPAEFYTHLGLFNYPEERSKRRQKDRSYYANMLMTWADLHDIVMDETIRSLISSGFGNFYFSEDQFDALVGLYGMINVIQGNHPFGEPANHRLSKIEGWIFGQDQPDKEF